jgi:hypothetical protein
MVTTVAEVTAKSLMRIMFFEATFAMMSASEIQQSLPSRGGVTISNHSHHSPPLVKEEAPF